MARSASVKVLASFFSLCLLGCGGTPVTHPNGPLIFSEPQSAQVPLGNSATFTVEASGVGPLTYQWFKNDVSIPGATGQTYTIQSVGTADAGNFRVEITNQGGTAGSTAATLSLGPRYPLAGDLRFQQIDSIDTVGGYQGRLTTAFQGGGGIVQYGGFGTPLSVGPSCPADTLLAGPSVSCLWILTTFYQPSNAPRLNVGYTSTYFPDSNSALASVAMPARVITAMDLEPDYSVFTFSYIEQTQGAAFDGLLHTADASSLQASLSGERQNGRVVTAIFPGNGGATYLSYGWQSNGSTKYDCKVLSATYANVGSVAQELADEGYIITAMGGNEYVGINMVGTKVQGDTLPRPLKVVPGGTSPISLASGGYGVVGTIYSAFTGQIATIGEK